MLRGLFDDYAAEQKFPNDYIFDWMTHREKVLKLKEQKEIEDKQKALKKKDKKNKGEKPPNKRELLLLEQKRIFE